jgi:hypothetical protein
MPEVTDARIANLRSKRRHWAARLPEWLHVRAHSLLSLITSGAAVAVTSVLLGWKTVPAAFRFFSLWTFAALVIYWLYVGWYALHRKLPSGQRGAGA